jgi:hypothetical protein
MLAMTTAQHIQQAMVQLRTGKITPDEFRAIMRAAKQGKTTQQWDKDKGTAVALDQRNPYGA